MAIIHKIKLEWYQYLKYKIHNERSKAVGVIRVQYKKRKKFEQYKTFDKTIDFDGYFYQG